MLDESVLREGKLCVVGNINRDIKTAPIAAGDYLFADGETSVGGIYETIGGGGANSAAIAAKLGAQVTFLGQVGTDELGARLESALTRQGVRCRMHRAASLATGTTVNLVYTSGQRHFLSCHPNNAGLQAGLLDLSALGGGQHLLRADIWFSDAMLYGGNETIFRAARAAGLSISIDLNWDPQWGRASLAELARRKDAIRGVLPLVDLAHGNIRELNEFTGLGDLEMSLRVLAEWGLHAVVIHMGEQGAGYFADGQLIVAPPAPVEHHRHSTGTGDVLSVCLMLLHHRADIPVRDKLQLANRIVADFIEGKQPLIPAL